MLSKKIAKEVLNTALATGGDFAEIYLETSISRSYKVENELTDTISTSEVSGCGIRILNDLQSVYGSTNDLSKKSLLSLAETLSKRFEGERKITVEKIKDKKIKQNDTIEIPYDQVDVKEIIDFLKSNTLILKNYDEHIIRRISSLSTTNKVVEIYNSKGLHAVDNRTHTRVGTIAMVNKDGKVETSFTAKGTRSGWEFFKSKFDYHSKVKNGAAIVMKMVDAKECPSGKMPVVIGNGWGGVLFHEACGHPLEATAVAKELSCFAGKKGEVIASSIVSAYDDATLANERGSSNMDDEGNEPKKNELIKNGVCTGFLVDSFNARRMPGETENGASRRQNYSYEPTSRMSNTYIANGESTPEEIIASTKLGLYAVSFGGGSVNPTTGEFNFGCSEAYIIRDGKIAEPVRGATLIGKGDEILHQIDMVGNDLDLADGMCGSSSGSIPVQVGQPTIRLKEITVGGAGGKLQ